MITREKIVQQFHKAEPFIFALIVLASCLFFFRHYFFPTLDSPAHLYNAKLLTEFWTGDPGPLSEYFALNTDILPNYTSHLLLAFFNSIFPPNLAEKIYLSVYLAAFCYSFRYFIRGWPAVTPFGALLALPFACSAFLFLGFYNFTLAFVFLLLSLGYWMRMKNNPQPKKWIFLGLLLLVTYFSHLLIFLVTATLVVASFSWDLLLELIYDKNNRNRIFRTQLGRFFTLLLIMAPGIYLVWLYKAERPETYFNFFPPEKVTESFYHAIGFVALSHVEIPGAQMFHWLILFSIAFIFLYRFYKGNDQQDFSADFFLIGAAGLFILAYLAPDGDSRGGFVIQRLVLLTSFLCILWISVQKFPFIPKLILILAFTGIHFKLMAYRTSLTGDLSRCAGSIVQASRFIEPYSVIVPVNKSTNWLQGHQSNYLGASRPVIILENYEAAQDYFPIHFKNDLPLPQSPSASVFCNEYIPRLYSDTRKPDYLFILGNENTLPYECDSLLNLFIKNKAELKYSSQFCSLYKIDNRSE